ncbi:hypothetical protein NC653_012412 [Populus alba x Populus x berolinensis]|uniref:Uncharacterized protein n=1 Tax=Populus alba x Populus x berolinensis TaxID=444605 RepID=A0AAD6W858_9ROSI|nr:hypothetical protein NC653_012412 [Populus alba x Populus x berolinensis]
MLRADVIVEERPTDRKDPRSLDTYNVGNGCSARGPQLEFAPSNKCMMGEPGDVPNGRNKGDSASSGIRANYTSGNHLGISGQTLCSEEESEQEKSKN